jgi:hypothetical protein
VQVRLQVLRHMPHPHCAALLLVVDLWTKML